MFDLLAYFPSNGARSFDVAFGSCYFKDDDNVVGVKNLDSVVYGISVQDFFLNQTFLIFVYAAYLLNRFCDDDYLTIREQLMSYILMV